MSNEPTASPFPGPESKKAFEEACSLQDAIATAAGGESARDPELDALIGLNDDRDAHIINLWTEWCNVERARNSKYEEGEDEPEKSLKYYDHIDRLRIAINEAKAETAKGIAVKLWAALSQISCLTELSEIIAAGDYDELRYRDSELGNDTRMIVDAVLQLERIGGFALMGGSERRTN